MDEMNVMAEEMINEVPANDICEEPVGFFKTEKGQLTIAGLTGFVVGVGAKYAVKGIKGACKKIFSGKKKKKDEPEFTVVNE